MFAVAFQLERSCVLPGHVCQEGMALGALAAVHARLKAEHVHAKLPREYLVGGEEPYIRVERVLNREKDPSAVQVQEQFCHERCQPVGKFDFLGVKASECGEACRVLVGPKRRGVGGPQFLQGIWDGVVARAGHRPAWRSRVGVSYALLVDKSADLTLAGWISQVESDD